MIITGKVIKGHGIGKKIGFPTINIKTDQQVDLKHGVYACKVTFNDKTYNGVMHYGPRPAFNDSTLNLEVYLIDFNGDLYGKNVKIEILDFIRETMNFDSIEDLVIQMNNDVEKTKLIFSIAENI